MPTFEIEANGKKYQIEAPSQQEALAAFQRFSGGEPQGQRAMMPNLTGVPIFGPVLGMAGYDGRTVEGASMVPALDPINAAGSKLAESIPVVGPALADFGNQVDARFASMVEGRDVTPDERAQITESNQERFPVATTAGEVAGIVGPFAAAAGTQLGAKALGVTGPLWQRVMAGSLTGGTVAGADTKARGGTDQQVGLNTLLGAATGGAFPLAERGVSAIIQALMGSNTSKAAQTLSSGMQRDKVNPAVMRAMLDQMGPEAVLADLGPNMTRQAAALASLPGEAQTIVREALLARNAGANTRLRADVNDAIGPAPVPTRVAAEIKDQQRALSPLYEEAFANASRVDTSPIALNLDSIIVNQRGAAASVARELRDMLNVVGTEQLDPNPRTLFAVRNAIDGMFDTVQDGNARRVLGETRKMVDEMLAQSVPGIKEVDAQFANLAREGEAFEAGRSVLDGGKSAMPPETLSDMLKSSEGVQNFLARMSQGTRAEIERLLGTKANNILALRDAVKGDGSWNRDKLAQLFGAERAERLIGILEREVTFQNTLNAAIRNSETAARSAAMSEVAPRQFGERPSSVVDLLLRIPQAGANAAARTRSEGVNKMIAEALMSKPSPELVDQIIAARKMAQSPSLVAPAAPALMLTNQ